MRRGLAVALLLTIATMSTPAGAYPTEIRSPQLIRRAAIEEWKDKARERWQAKQAAEESEPSVAVPYVPPPPPVPTGGMAALIYSIFGTNGAAAVSVVSCESGLNPNAVNSSSGAAGLFQLMPFHWQGKFDPYDPAANARYAYSLSGGGTNWGAWVCQP